LEEFFAAEDWERLSATRIGILPTAIEDLHGRSNAAVPGVMMLETRYFRDETLASDVREDLEARHTVAHEMFHEYQRLRGDLVTVQGFVEQVMLEIGIAVYGYDHSLSGGAMLEQFMEAGVEAQAEIFADAVLMSVEGRPEVERYRLVLEHVSAPARPWYLNDPDRLRVD